MSNPSTPPSPAPASPPRAAAPVQSTRKPLQFSMRTLLIVVTVIAVASALLSYFGASIIIIAVGVVTMMVVPVCLGTLALYCRGFRQTYFIGAFAGALYPHVSGAVATVSSVGQLVLICMIQLIACTACGYAALATRRFLERRGWHLPPNHDDSTPRA